MSDTNIAGQKCSHLGHKSLSFRNMSCSSEIFETKPIRCTAKFRFPRPTAACFRRRTCRFRIREQSLLAVEIQDSANKTYIKCSLFDSSVERGFPVKITTVGFDLVHELCTKTFDDCRQSARLITSRSPSRSVYTFCRGIHKLALQHESTKNENVVYLQQTTSSEGMQLAWCNSMRTFAYRGIPAGRSYRCITSSCLCM